MRTNSTFSPYLNPMPPTYFSQNLKTNNMNKISILIVLLSTLVLANKVQTASTECASPVVQELPPTSGWKGTQKTFDEFRRLSPSTKSVLRSFELSHVEDLDMDILLGELRPCTSLESIRLIDVELLGEFPSLPEQRLYLPNIHEFNLKLSYPPVPVPSSYLFISAKDEETLQRQVNIRLEVGGYINSVIDHNFGEFIVGYNASATVSKFLTNTATTNASLAFKLRRLSLKTTDVASEELIPPDLSFLQLMYVQLGSSAEAMEATYNQIIQKSKRLRSLHLAANEWEEPLLDFGQFPKSLESLSLTNFHLNTTKKTSFPRLRNFYINNCILDPPGIFEIMDSVVPHPQRFGITFPEGSGADCYALLQSLIFSSTYPLYDNLEFIFIEKCERSQENEANFEKVGYFLKTAGIGKNVSNFVLEKKEKWTGRNVEAVESKRIHYDFERWDKLESWNTFKNT